VVSLRVTAGNLYASQFSADRSSLNTSWHGDLAELIIYNRSLSASERQQVEDYLNSRYCFWLDLETCPFTP
jgi:hypothetical protein